VAFYRLPAFIAETLSSQPVPPRRVPIHSLVFAVLAGADGAIYAGSGVVFIAAGLLFLTGSLGFAPAPISTSLILVGVGLLPLLFVLFRVGQVGQALRSGDAHMAEITRAEVSRARFQGTPWGEPLVGPAGPIAARGDYRFIGSGETGHYYMQQSWALGLQPGAAIWVVRLNGRDILFAPTR